MLVEKDVKVSIIHFQVGYNSRSYFNKIFKATYGMTPNKYRQKYMK